MNFHTHREVEMRLQCCMAGHCQLAKDSTLPALQNKQSNQAHGEWKQGTCGCSHYPAIMSPPHINTSISCISVAECWWLRPWLQFLMAPPFFPLQFRGFIYRHVGMTQIVGLMIAIGLRKISSRVQHHLLSAASILLLMSLCLMDQLHITDMYLLIIIVPDIDNIAMSLYDIM